MAIGRQEQVAETPGTSAEEEQGWLFAIARSQLTHFFRRGEVERAAIRSCLGEERGPRRQRLEGS
jgi:hypothetical protein